jgi:hypothetical protein
MIVSFQRRKIGTIMLEINCSIWKLLIAAERQPGASCGFVLNTLNFFGYTARLRRLRFGTRH